MTGPGAGSGGGERNKRADLGGADAVPDTPSTAKRQGAEPNAAERRMTPRGAATETKSTSGGGGIKPVVWIVIAIVVIAVGYFLLGR